MRVSVVVPVLEDRDALLRVLPDLSGADEIIVVDASSRQALRVADLPAGVRLLRSGVAQRAAQMNLGAEVARGEILWFVHADTRLPSGTWDALRETMKDPEIVGGGFERSFDLASGFLRWTCRAAAWRGRAFGWFFGDQALFVRRSSLVEIGGVPGIDVFEDVELCRRLKRVGRLRALRPPVVSSGRRFRDGAVRRTWADLGLTIAYLVGGARMVCAIQNVE